MKFINDYVAFGLQFCPEFVMKFRCYFNHPEPILAPLVENMNAFLPSTSGSLSARVRMILWCL
ncbi:MAG: hypothetical protein Q7V10_01365 [Methanobacteriaceae archaeon]|nr:hypothetical protein [Methanobacteriaceae archaeon]MDO9628120.1 hypothetical protein [Methanobacteriaceae archaeon]